MGKQWKQWDFIFGDFKITADGDCSHEIKRHLLLGRKVMTNLESILKSRDITSPTNFRVVKALVFPVVMYGCENYKESWVPKLWFFWTVVMEKTLASLFNCKEIQSVHPKGFIGRTDAEAETPTLWPPDEKNWLIGKDPDAGKDWRWEEKGTREDEMVGWHHQFNGHEFEKLRDLVMDREAWCATVRGVSKNRTQLSDWTESGEDKKLGHNL